jgi:Lon protease-like protein
VGQEDIPLFPLNTVLFPGGPLPLRIFEPRYVDMVRDCLRRERPFGVLLIREGSEVGGATSTFAVGTLARIVDFNALNDGLLGITGRGEGRFRVLEKWRQPDGLNRGCSEMLPAVAPCALPGRYRHLADLLRRVMPELGAVYADIPRAFDEAGWVSCRLAEILPMDLGEKQRLLELDDPLERLACIDPLLERTDGDD